ncbi:MAG: hypothetical protein ACXVRU_08805 [Gaiellaceae bacterium]
MFSVIRNGIANGYPFVEAYGSWIGRAGRIVIVDGESDDGTRETLDALAGIDPSVSIESAPWPSSQSGGGAIAEFTADALELARSAASRLMYVQADEIYTDDQRTLILGHTKPTALRFAGCVNFWNSFDTVLENEFPMQYVRVFPASARVQSLADGFSFDVDGVPIEDTPAQFLHYGWCFPINILRKHISHGHLYRDDPGYRLRGWLAGLLLDQRRYDRRLLDALAPQYRPTPFLGAHPRAMQHVVAQREYDPNVGLEILRSGVRW